MPIVPPQHRLQHQHSRRRVTAEVLGLYVPSMLLLVVVAEGPQRQVFDLQVPHIHFLSV
jgi:hypothetical protein